MDGSISLSRQERKTLLEHYRMSIDPAVHLRAHILLLLADGRPWREIMAVLFTSASTIARWKCRFECEKARYSQKLCSGKRKKGGVSC